MYIEYFRMRNSAQPPRRANPSDAGMDLAFAPDVPGSITIQPGESMICATGLKFGVPHGYMLQIMNRSSVAARRSLIVGAHVVDAGYDGEVFINLHNIGGEAQRIYPGEKLAQVVLIPVEACKFVETSDRINVNTVRGPGGFGSTGR